MRFTQFAALLILGLFFIPAESTVGAYFVNWAKYRPAPYTFTASTLSSVISKVDEIYYSFYYFCPPPGTNPMPYWAQAPYGSCTDATAFQLMSVEPSDTQYIPTIVGYKSQNPNLKVLLSIGGWNFPSNYFSRMVSSASSRQTFIQSVVQTLNQYNLDGVDIDWEFPCSPPRMNPVEISCDTFRNVQDNGGSCPNDGQNLVLLAKELKSALGTKLLTIASQV
jgi:chitinase